MFSPRVTVISRRLAIAAALAWAAMLLLLLAMTPDQELRTVLRLSGVVILGFTGALAVARGWHVLAYLVFITSFFPVGWHFLGSPRYGIVVGVTMIVFALSAVVNHIQHDAP